MRVNTKKFLLILLLIMSLYTIYQFRKIKNLCQLNNFNSIKNVEIPRIELHYSCKSLESSFNNLFLRSSSLINRQFRKRGFSNLDTSSNKTSINDKIAVLGIVYWRNSYYAIIQCGSRVFVAKKEDIICNKLLIKDINKDGIWVMRDGNVEFLKLRR